MVLEGLQFKLDSWNVDFIKISTQIININFFNSKTIFFIKLCQNGKSIMVAEIGQWFMATCDKLCWEKIILMKDFMAMR